jgi:predicted nucleic acid-binding protein
MIVVSDTSPINYLVLIELQDLLPKLLDRVLIPDAVHRELRASGAPDPIRRFLADAPPWLVVKPSPPVVPALRHLDAGERETIRWRCPSGPTWCSSMSARAARPHANRGFECLERSA